MLDLLLERQPFFPAVSRLFMAFQEGRIEGYVSSLSYANLFYLLRKRIGGAKSIAILRKLRLITHVLPVDERVVDQALASSFTDFEDALQNYVAVEHGIEAIVTRNGRDYRTSKIAIVGAEDCLDPAAP